MKEGDAKVAAGQSNSDNLNSVIGKRLSRIRTHLGLTQKAIGELLEIGRNSWPRYESGEQMPGGAVIRSLSRRGFNANWILTGEGEMLLSAGHSVTSQTGNINVDKSLDQIQEVSTALFRIFEEEGLRKDESWFFYLQELMVVHGLSDKGAKRLLQMLRSGEPLPPSETPN